MVDITILDVGHGNAAVLQHDDQAVVIDAGVGTTLLEHLRLMGIRRIRTVVISHADFDHLKGLVAVLDQPDIAVDQVFVNSDAAKKSREWTALVFALDERRRSGECDFTVQLTEGMSFQFFDAAMNVLAPRAALAAIGPGGSDEEGRRITTNTISAVVSVRVAETQVLLPADIDAVGLHHLLGAGQDLQADVLVFPHHGGNVRPNASEADNREFSGSLLNAVRPATVVFSIGRGGHENPRPEVVESVSAAGATVMCTQMSRHCCGDVALPDRHLSNAFAAGRAPGRCCAGSIVASAAGLDPHATEHQAFVELNAPSALCRRGM